MADEQTRQLAPSAASALLPGDDHYRAFVGPPHRYDLLSASQFALLFLMGMREHHKLLDFGCGSLRLGRLAIPYLAEGGYCGVEPEAWLVEEGFARELGHDARDLKRPRFDHNRDCRVDLFNERFDFIIAQSVFSHTGQAMAETALANFAGSLADDGVILANWMIGEEKRRVHPKTSGWVYPGCVNFVEQRVVVIAERLGLSVIRLAWPHPTLTWFALAKSPEALPSVEAATALGVSPLSRSR